MNSQQWRALIGLIITVSISVAFGLQVLRITRSRSISRIFNSKTKKPFRLLRKDATVITGCAFLIFCLAMEVTSMFDDQIASYFVIFRHLFFLAWVATIMRHWVFVLDPLHRQVSKAMFQSLWNVARISSFVVIVIIMLLLGSGTANSNVEEHNAAVWLAASALVIPASGLYMMYLRKAYKQCNISVERNADVITPEDRVQVTTLLTSRTIDLDVLKRQDGVAHLLGLTLQIHAIKNLFGFFITIMTFSLFHEIIWIMSMSHRNQDPESFIAEEYNTGLSAMYCWLPQLLPFLYWVVCILPPGRIFAENRSRKRSRTDDSVTRLSQVVYVNRKRPSTNHAQESDAASDISAPLSEAGQTPSRPHSGYLAWVGAERLEMGKEMYFTEPPQTWLSFLKKMFRIKSKMAARETSIVETTMMIDGIYDRCREVHIACSEALILDKQAEIPIASMFSGYSTFAVLSCSDARIPDSEWIEVGRSDLQSQRLNPDFSTNFMVPVDPARDKFRLWRIALYNVVVNNPSFSVKDTNLSQSLLVGIVYFCADEIVQKTPKFFDFDSETTESVDNYCELVKPIVMRKYDSYSLRFGGGCVLRIRNIDLYCRYIPMLLPKRRSPILLMSAEDGAAAVDTKQKGRSQSMDKTFEQTKVLIKPMVLARSFLIHSNAHSCASIAAGISGDMLHRDIYVREECVESPYCVTVPLAFLKALFVRRQRETEAYAREAMFFDNDLWITEILRMKEELLNDYTNAIDYYLSEAKDLSFKSSKLKDSFDLRFVPTNLHLQMLLSSMDFRNERGLKCGGNYESKTRNRYVAYDIVTVGAFAAHPLKFKKGGAWHYMNKLEKRRLEIEQTSENFIGPTYASCTEVWHMKRLPWDESVHELAFAASQRIDICLSQCLAALVTGFLAKIQLVSASSTPSEMENLCALGILVQFESLLSTHGKELGMLADMYCAVRCLDNVQFQIHCNSNKGNLPASVGMYWKGEGTRNEVLMIDLGVNEEYFNTLPSIIQEGNTIPIVPVMFTVGVNELQSLANASNPNATHLQDVINAESVSRVCQYVQLLQRLADGQFHETIQPLEESYARELSTSSADGSEPLRSSMSSSQDASTVGPDRNQVSDESSNNATSTPTRQKSGDQMSLKLAAHRVILLRQMIMTTDAGRNLNSGMMFVNVENSDDDKLRIDSLASHTSLEVHKALNDEKDSSRPQSSKRSQVEIIEEGSLEDEEEGEEDDDEDVDYDASALRASRSGRSGSVRPIGDVLLNLTRRESIASGSHTSNPRLSILKSPLMSHGTSGVELGRMSMSEDGLLSANIRASIASGHTNISAVSQPIPALPDMLEESSGPPVPYPGGVGRPSSARSNISSVVVNPLSAGSPDIRTSESDGTFSRDDDASSSPPRKSSQGRTNPSTAKKSGTAKNLTELNRIFNKLNEHVRESAGMGGKPIQILFAAAKLTRAVDGIRLTSCKSGKDRTGMSVTYEEANIIKERYKIGDLQYEELLETLRVDGVRLRNAEKNIGKAKFAFNTFQRKFLPDEFVPPLSTIGSVQS